MIVDGKKIAEEILAGLGQNRKDFPPKLCLGVLMGEADAASASFVKIKERVADKLQVVVVRELLNTDATTEYALRSLERLTKTCAGVIVQMPLPPQINLGQILDALPPHLDVDAITENQTLVRAPAAGAPTNFPAPTTTAFFPAAATPARTKISDTASATGARTSV